MTLVPDKKPKLAVKQADSGVSDEMSDKDGGDGSTSK